MIHHRWGINEWNGWLAGWVNEWTMLGGQPISLHVYISRGLDWDWTLRGERPVGLDDVIIIIITATLVPLSRHVNKRIDHHRHHHHHAQNNFIQVVFWRISNGSHVIARIMTSFVLDGWWVQAFRGSTVPPTITFRRWGQFVRNVFLYPPNYTVSLSGGPDYEPSPSWKPPILRYHVCCGCNLPVVDPVCRLECAFPNQLPR